MEKILQVVKDMDDLRAQLDTLKSQHREEVQKDGSKLLKDIDASRDYFRKELTNARASLIKAFNEEANKLSTKMPAEVFEERVRELAEVASKENISMAHIRHLTRARLGLPGKSKVERARSRRNKARKAKEAK